MHRRPLSFLITLTLILAVTPVFAASQENVTVRVTPTLVSISVSPTSVNLGAVALNQESASSNEVSVTNNGTVAEDFDIKGATASSGSYQWSLIPGVPSTDQFRHSFALSPYSSYAALDTANVDLENNVSASGASNFKLKIELPSAINGTYTQYSTSVTVTATEHP